MTSADERAALTVLPAPDPARAGPADAGPPAVGPLADVEQAWRDAGAAARAAGVDVREVSALDQIEQVGQLYGRIWVRDGPATVSNELMRALAKAGNYVAGAFDGGTLVGACVGFFSAPVDRALHSHIAGVSPAVRGRSVGYALKVHQRAWAMQRGLQHVVWTFDPLVSRNAYFNVVKLAARPVEYLPNFYGRMLDGINAGDDSDRLLVHWQLSTADVARSCGGRPAQVDAVAERGRGAVTALGSSARGGPVAGVLDATVSLVAVPRDIERVRRDDSGLAREWRVAVRQTLTTLLSDGGEITGFDRAGWYVVRRAPTPPGPEPGGQPVTGTREVWG